MKPLDREMDDEQLDQLLRDIDVPVDLKSSLRSISNVSVTRLESSQSVAPAVGRNTGRRKLLVQMVLAASLLGIAAFFSWEMLSSGNSSGDVPAVAEVLDPVIDVESPKPSTPNNDVQLRLDSIAELRSEYELALARHELRGLESRLQQIRVASGTSLSHEENAAMILALADQAVIPLGGDAGKVNQDMTGVIERYPNTRGAKIAQQFLSQ